MDTGHVHLNFICFNSDASFENGNLELPFDFTVEYGDKIPDLVYLQVPSGAVWQGEFVKQNRNIEGLHKMVDYYGLNRYNLALLKFKGGPNFNLHIFNCYAVEIDYAFRMMVCKNPTLSNPTGTLGGVKNTNILNVEVDQLAATFDYNAYTHYQNIYELKIEKKHLNGNEILSKQEMSPLNVDESVESIQLGFQRHKWEILLEWDNQQLKFGSGWRAFVYAANLQVGDVCIIQTTAERNTFEVAVFNAKEITEWSDYNGEEQDKVKTIFFKITDDKSLQKGEIVFPRVFIEKFGNNLKEGVQLWMADRNVWITPLYKNGSCIFGLERLQEFYAIKKDFILVFQYLGKTTFYLSIFSPNGLDIVNAGNQSMVLKDVVVMEYGNESSQNIHDPEDDYITSDELISDYMSSEDSEHAVVDQNLQGCTIQQNNDSFLVTLSSSHLDSKSHGVYFPRTLIAFYQKWRKGKNIILSYRASEWEISTNRAGKRCRLGKGWSSFVKDNSFAVGDCLKFDYVDAASQMFQVSKQT